MSELTNTRNDGHDFRWHLLGTVSALVLIASSSGVAASDDSDHPVLWIELGGDADMINGIGEPFTAPFLQVTPTPSPYTNGSPVDQQKPSRFTFGGDASLSFQPEDSNWVFSANVRYGRSNNRRDVHHQTAQKSLEPNGYYYLHKLFYPGTPSKFTNYPNPKYATAQKFAETTVTQSESHMVLDFQAGKDVGLGLFGHGGMSVLSGGVRLARFDSRSDVKIRAKPGVDFYTRTAFSGQIRFPQSKWSTYYLHGSASRSFSGVGPSLSWKASAPVAGSVEGGQLSLDWGINGAVLFGRQKAKTSHTTTRRDFRAKYSVTFPTTVNPNGHKTTHYTTHYKNNPPAQNRSRFATVPNIGALIGFSYRIEDAKLSLGYRADLFFGATDGGIDTARKENVGFYGPFATISIGLGG